jgi:hypothetical protein
VFPAGRWVRRGRVVGIHSFEGVGRKNDRGSLRELRQSSGAQSKVHCAFEYKGGGGVV